MQFNSIVAHRARVFSILRTHVLLYSQTSRGVQHTSIPHYKPWLKSLLAAIQLINERIKENFCAFWYLVRLRILLMPMQRRKVGTGKPILTASPRERSPGSGHSALPAPDLCVAFSGTKMFEMGLAMSRPGNISCECCRLETPLRISFAQQRALSLVSAGCPHWARTGRSPAESSFQRAQITSLWFSP